MEISLTNHELFQIKLCYHNKGKCKCREFWYFQMMMFQNNETASIPLKRTKVKCFSRLLVILRYMDKAYIILYSPNLSIERTAVGHLSLAKYHLHFWKSAAPGNWTFYFKIQKFFMPQPAEFSQQLSYMELPLLLYYSQRSHEDTFMLQWLY